MSANLIVGAVIVVGVIALIWWLTSMARSAERTDIHEATIDEAKDAKAAERRADSEPDPVGRLRDRWQR